MLTKRKLKGKVVSRTQHHLDETNELYIELHDLPHGSIEIESISARNLRIPYSAVTAFYVTDECVSMIHSYRRNHSLIELEDKKCLTQGRESCCVIRSAAGIRNKAAFHNGDATVLAQTGSLVVTNLKGLDKHYMMQMSKLQPFETYLFYIEGI